MINITPQASAVQKTLNLSRYKRKKPASSVRPEPKKKSSRGIRAFHLSYSIFIYSSSSGFIYSSCLDFVSFIIKNELSRAEREYDIGRGPLFQSQYNFMLNQGSVLGLRQQQIFCNSLNKNDTRNLFLCYLGYFYWVLYAMMRRSFDEGYQGIWAGTLLTWDFRRMIYGGTRALSRMLQQFI